MQRHLHYVGVPERPRPERELLFRLGLLFRRHPEGLSSSEASLLRPGHLRCYTRAMETTDMETATIKTPKSCSYMSSFTISVTISTVRLRCSARSCRACAAHLRASRGQGELLPAGAQSLRP